MAKVLALVVLMAMVLTGATGASAQEFKRDRNATISSLGKQGYRVMAYASGGGYVVMQNNAGDVALCSITRPSNDRNSANSNCMRSQAK